MCPPNYIYIFKREIKKAIESVKCSSHFILSTHSKCKGKSMAQKTPGGPSLAFPPWHSRSPQTWLTLSGGRITHLHMVKQFRHWNRFKLVLKEGKENIRCIPHVPQSILHRQVTLHFAFLGVPEHSLNRAHKSPHPWWNIAVSSTRKKGRLVPEGGAWGEDPSSARTAGSVEGPILCLDSLGKSFLLPTHHHLWVKSSCFKTLENSSSWPHHLSSPSVRDTQDH